MYVFESALAKLPTNLGRWVNVDITGLSFQAIFSTYSRVLVLLSHPLVQGKVSFDLDVIRTEKINSTETFGEFLIANGNTPLETSYDYPVLNTRYAEYADAFHAGYKATPIHPTAAPDAPYPLADKTTLYLTRPNTDYNLFVKSCMVSINGFYHLVDGGVNGIYIPEATKSVLLSNENLIGILSFRKLGSLTYLPIKKEMLYKNNPDTPYSERCCLDLGQDVSNKTIILVLGGYMHLLDTMTFYRTSDRTITIDTNNMPLLERYFESREHLDLDALPLQKTTRNPDQISVDDFNSDANMEAYFTLPQSFIVLLDNTEVFTETSDIQKTPNTDQFVSYTAPIYPLVVGYGKVANYWYMFEDGQYALNCLHASRLNYVFKTTKRDSLKNVSNATVPGKRFDPGIPHYLKIGTDI